MRVSFTAADLKNTTLKIGMFDLPPNIIIQHLPSGEQKVTGIAAEILEIIANYVGFKCSYITYPMGIIGREINGTWDGIMGGLINEDIDIEGILLVPAPYRLKVIEFSTSALFENYVGVVTHKPTEDQNLSFLTYFKPYPVNIWVSIILLWLATCICTTILDYGVTTTIWKPILLKLFLLEKLSKKKFRLTVSKMITILAFFAALIVLLSGYNSVLIASVAFKHTYKQFENIDDLLEDGSYKFGANHGAYYYRHILEMKDPPYGKLGDIMQSDPDSNILDLDIGFKRALNENFGFIVESIFAKYGIQSMCSLKMLPAKYFSSGLHFSFGKNSPIREIISQYIHRLRTTGLLRVIAERKISSSRPCNEDAHKVTPMSLNYVVFPFKIVGYGIVFSILVLVLEILQSRFTK